MSAPSTTVWVLNIAGESPTAWSSEAKARAHLVEFVDGNWDNVKVVDGDESPDLPADAEEAISLFFYGSDEVRGAYADTDLEPDYGIFPAEVDASANCPACRQPMALHDPAAWRDAPGGHAPEFLQNCRHYGSAEAGPNLGVDTYAHMGLQSAGRVDDRPA